MNILTLDLNQKRANFCDSDNYEFHTCFYLIIRNAEKARYIRSARAVSRAPTRHTQVQYQKTLTSQLKTRAVRQ